SLVEPLNDLGDEMTDLVVRLANINSGSYNAAGVEKVVDLLDNEFSSLGGKASRIKVAPKQEVDDQGIIRELELGPLLQIQKRSELDRRVLLCIHSDTVYAEDSPFQKCQPLPNGNLNGPGVADAKGGLVVMLYALKMLEQTELGRLLGWEVIINPDEELGSPGSEQILRDRATLADVGLLFEPALPDGSMVSARKGVGNFVFVVRGKSVHAGREFKNGRNAVTHCCRLMQKIDELNQHDDVILNVGRIQGGAALNVVPDLCIGRINTRVKTVEQMEQLHSTLESLTQKFDQVDGFQVEMHGGFSSPPKECIAQQLEMQRLIGQCASQLGRDLVWRETGGASDGNKFSAVGLPNIDTMGPLGGSIHSFDEFLMPESLVESAKLTTLTLLSLTL
ncbi:MAG: hydrolase, partial [Planctomycetota bacterium]